MPELYRVLCSISDPESDDVDYTHFMGVFSNADKAKSTIEESIGECLIWKSDEDGSCFAFMTAFNYNNIQREFWFRIDKCTVDKLQNFYLLMRLSQVVIEA